MVIRHKVLLTGLAILLIVTAAAFMLVNRNPLGTASPTQEEVGAGESAPSARSGLADSSDKVRVKVAGTTESKGRDTGEIVLTLDIEPGWHVNANPASMEFLIPTAASSSVNGQSFEITTQYPRGRVSDITLDDTALKVYDDGASIRLLPDEKQTAMLQEAGKLDVKVRVQACSEDGVCLAPSDLPLTLDLDGTNTP